MIDTHDIIVFIVLGVLILTSYLDYQRVTRLEGRVHSLEDHWMMGLTQLNNLVRMLTIKDELLSNTLHANIRVLKGLLDERDDKDNKTAA